MATMAITTPHWKEDLISFAGILGGTTLLGIILVAVTYCVIYCCSNPNQLPSWLKSVRDLLHCYKYHPHPDEDTELNLLPLNETLL